jgi:hypothetical protein
MITTWYFWLGVIFVLLFIMWIFAGGQNFKFVGLSPLAPDYSIKENLGSDIIEKELNEIEETMVLEEAKKEYPTEFKQDQGYRAKSRGESICKQCMEIWFKSPFYTLHPEWLKYPKTGRKLELDLYNDSWQIAVEYNGIQHYKFPNRFMRDKSELIEQMARDKWKTEQCDKNGVYLIVVPYTIKDKDIPNFLKSRLPEHILPLIKDDVKVDDEDDPITDEDTEDDYKVHHI